jgi:hypothetical protein
MTTPEPPEFGPNGAVVNRPGLSERMRRQLRGEAVPDETPKLVRAAWLGLLVLLYLMQVWRTPLIDTLGERVVLSALPIVFFVRTFWPMGRVERGFWGASALGVIGYFLWIMLR